MDSSPDFERVPFFLDPTKNAAAMQLQGELGQADT
jgi:hypothetical protein